MIVIGFLVSIIPVIAPAQTLRIDALKKRLSIESSPRERINTILKICEQHYSLPVDSLLHYIKLGEAIVENKSPEYFKIKNFYCNYLSKIDRSEDALKLNDSLLHSVPSQKIFEKAAEALAVSRCGLLIRNNQPKDAIEQSLILLERAEQSHDTLMIVRNCSIFLGWANLELEQYNEAIKWLRFGDNYTRNENILIQSHALYSNMASCYNNIGRYDSALYFINIALRYDSLGEVLSGMANALNIRADIYINTNQPVAAEKDMKEALKVREQIGDILYVVSDMAQLSFFYASIKETDKGIEVAQKGIALASKTNNISKLIFLHNALAENYKVAGMQDKYASSLSSIMTLKDSLYKENSGKAIAEMEAKYQLQKKENIIIKQNLELTRSRYTAIGSVALLIAGLLFVWVLYRNYRLIQRRKMESALAEQKLISYKAVEQAKENERKRIAADLHDNLGSYAAAITANVKYLNDNKEDKDNILLQLELNAQSMVTQLGDTIWVLKNEQLQITKLADRFKSWILRLIQNYPHIKYHYSEDIREDAEFSPSKILHIFLILKECVNNAIKHSNCTELRINVFSDQYWYISIQDNGKGYDHELASKGSGINNIKNRAKECGWNVEWKKAEPSGTKVIISGSTTK